MWTRKRWIGFLTFFISITAVVRAEQVWVNEMQISDVSPAGRTLSVFYVSAREGFWRTAGQVLKIHSIKEGPISVPITEDGRAEVPGMCIKDEGIETFNYLVFVIHPTWQETVFLRNLDGSYPSDPRIFNEDRSWIPEDLFGFERIEFMSVSHFNQLSMQQGASGYVSIFFDRDTKH